MNLNQPGNPRSQLSWNGKQKKITKWNILWAILLHRLRVRFHRFFFFFGKSILSVSVLLKKKRCVTLQNFVENMSATARFSSYVITFSTRNHVSSVTAALRACYHGSNANFEVSEKTVELGRDWSWLMIDSPRGSIPGKPWIQTLLNGVHILWTNL